MLRFKHVRLDQEKIERVKAIFNAKTETEALDKALTKIIQEDEEKRRRKKIAKGMMELRLRMGRIKEDTAEWVRQGRRGRDLVYGGGT